MVGVWEREMGWDRHGVGEFGWVCLFFSGGGGLAWLACWERRWVVLGGLEGPMTE